MRAYYMNKFVHTKHVHTYRCANNVEDTLQNFTAPMDNEFDKLIAGIDDDIIDTFYNAQIKY